MEDFPNTSYTEPHYSVPNSNHNEEGGRSSGLATASLVLGILSLLLVCCGFSFILGALGILFALISRGAAKMSTSAKTGLGLSIGGLVLTFFVYIAFLINFFVSPVGREFIYEMRYGTGYDDNQYLEDFLYNYLYEQGQGSYDSPSGDDYDYNYDDEDYKGGDNFVSLPEESYFI